MVKIDMQKAHPLTRALHVVRDTSEPRRGVDSRSEAYGGNVVEKWPSPGQREQERDPDHSFTPAPSSARDSALPAVVVMAAPADSSKPRKKKKATIARRSPEEAAETDSTCTPKWLAELIGPRDFDPCSNQRSHIQATRRYAQDGSHTHGTDGLAPEADWSGTGFLNNPWSKPIAWMLRSQRALKVGGCVDLVVLCKCDPGTEWWHTINAAPDRIRLAECAAPELWHFHKRVQFDEHPAVIERRRIERVALAIEEGETDPEKLSRITGKSTANFNSAIIHHRGDGYPVLNLGDVATRYVRAYA